MLEKAKLIKAMFFDVDGTLYDHEIHDFTEPTKATLHQLAQQGYELFVATSRSEQELKHVWDLIDQFSFSGVITSGGALTRLHRDIVDVRYIDDTDTFYVMEYCRRHRIDVRWQTLDACFFDFEPADSSAEVFDTLYQMIPGVEAWNGQRLLSVLCYANQEQAQHLASVMPNSAFVHYQGAIEICGPDVNKATAIQRLASTMGWSMEEVAAFGDGENDERMLREAGIGIAMGNGSVEAKEAADMITNGISEDGIAVACQLLGFVNEGVTL